MRNKINKGKVEAKKLLAVICIICLVLSSMSIVALAHEGEIECCYWHIYYDECLPAEGGYSDYFYYELAQYRDEFSLIMPFSTTMRTYNRNNTTQGLYLFNGQRSSLFTVGMIRCRHTTASTPVNLK